MKIITAREFSRHSSLIGKYLSTNPSDYLIVHHGWNVDKSFVCLSLPAFGLVSGDKIRSDIYDFIQTEKIKQKERQQRQGKGIKGDKIGTNDNAKGHEMVSTIACSNRGITSLCDFVSSITGVED